MKLSAIHKLYVEDLSIPLTEADDDKDDDKEDDKDKDEDGGNKKNENSPAAKAYHGTGLSQQEIADKAKVNKSTISRYKSKDPDIQRKPLVGTLERLASAGVNVRQMLPNIFR